MNIAVFGLGYVGCVTLGCLANEGNNMIGVDISEQKVKLINEGKPTIIEKDIDRLIEFNFHEKRISSTQDYQFAVANSDISIIAVGTPTTSEGQLNLEFIFKVAEEIGEALKNKASFHVIIIRSTVLPGTNERVGEILGNKSGKKRNIDFSVVSNPEFLREGSAVEDYFNPPMTVIGTDNDKTFKILQQLYVNINAPMKRVEIKEAEIIKYVNNSFHALKICFANEVGNICKKLGINSHSVMDLFSQDKKLNISANYLKPGFAYGGSCLPKDLKALKTIAHDYYLNTPVLNAIELSNDKQKEIVIKMIEQYGKRKIGVLGISFKEGTDDLRYSPIIEVIEYYVGKGYDIFIYDEHVNFSKISGTNKDYIDKHIPHLASLINGDYTEVIDPSEIIIIAHKLDFIESLLKKYPDKIFIDLVKITSNKFDNYEGICW